MKKKAFFISSSVISRDDMAFISRKKSSVDIFPSSKRRKTPF
jgi:hypothetical protein